MSIKQRVQYEEFFDPTHNRPYFRNSVTGEVTWEIPLEDFDDDQTDGSEQQNATATDASVGVGTAKPQRYLDETTGNYYVLDPVTGEVRWETRESMDDNPWQEFVDQNTHKPYLYNTKTGEVRWAEDEATKNGAEQNTTTSAANESTTASAHQHTHNIADENATNDRADQGTTKNGGGDENTSSNRADQHTTNNDTNQDPTDNQLVHTFVETDVPPVVANCLCTDEQDLNAAGQQPISENTQQAVNQHVDSQRFEPEVMPSQEVHIAEATHVSETCTANDTQDHQIAESGVDANLPPVSSAVESQPIAVDVSSPNTARVMEETTTSTIGSNVQTTKSLDTADIGQHAEDKIIAAVQSTPQVAIASFDGEEAATAHPHVVPQHSDKFAVPSSDLEVAQTPDSTFVAVHNHQPQPDEISQNFAANVVSEQPAVDQTDSQQDATNVSSSSETEHAGRCIDPSRMMQFFDDEAPNRTLESAIATDPNSIIPTTVQTDDTTMTECQPVPTNDSSQSLHMDQTTQLPANLDQTHEQHAPPKVTPEEPHPSFLPNNVVISVDSSTSASGDQQIRNSSQQRESSELLPIEVPYAANASRKRSSSKVQRLISAFNISVVEMLKEAAPPKKGDHPTNPAQHETHHTETTGPHHLDLHVNGTTDSFDSNSRPADSAQPAIEQPLSSMNDVGTPPASPPTQQSQAPDEEFDTDATGRRLLPAPSLPPPPPPPVAAAVAATTAQPPAATETSKMSHLIAVVEDAAFAPIRAQLSDGDIRTPSGSQGSFADDLQAPAQQQSDSEQLHTHDASVSGATANSARLETVLVKEATATSASKPQPKSAMDRVTAIADEQNAKSLPDAPAQVSATPKEQTTTDANPIGLVAAPAMALPCETPATQTSHKTAKAEDATTNTQTGVPANPSTSTLVTDAIPVHTAEPAGPTQETATTANKLNNAVDHLPPSPQPNPQQPQNAAQAPTVESPTVENMLRYPSKSDSPKAPKSALGSKTDNVLGSPSRPKRELVETEVLTTPTSVPLQPSRNTNRQEQQTIATVTPSSSVSRVSRWSADESSNNGPSASPQKVESELNKVLAVLELPRCVLVTTGMDTFGKTCTVAMLDTKRRFDMKTLIELLRDQCSALPDVFVALPADFRASPQTTPTSTPEQRATKGPTQTAVATPIRDTKPTPPQAPQTQPVRQAQAQPQQQKPKPPPPQQQQGAPQKQQSLTQLSLEQHSFLTPVKNSSAQQAARTPTSTPIYVPTASNAQTPTRGETLSTGTRLIDPSKMFASLPSDDSPGKPTSAGARALTTAIPADAPLQKSQSSKQQTRQAITSPNTAPPQAQPTLHQQHTTNQPHHHTPAAQPQPNKPPTQPPVTTPPHHPHTQQQQHTRRTVVQPEIIPVPAPVFAPVPVDPQGARVAVRPSRRGWVTAKYSYQMLADLKVIASVDTHSLLEMLTDLEIQPQLNITGPLYLSLSTKDAQAFVLTLHYAVPASTSPPRLVNVVLTLQSLMLIQRQELPFGPLVISVFPLIPLLTELGESLHAVKHVQDVASPPMHPTQPQSMAVSSSSGRVARSRVGPDQN